MVIYRGSSPVWATNTRNPQTAWAELALEDDNDLVLWRMVNNNFQEVWSTNTAGR